MPRPMTEAERAAFAAALRAEKVELYDLLQRNKEIIQSLEADNCSYVKRIGDLVRSQEEYR